MTSTRDTSPKIDELIKVLNKKRGSIKGRLTNFSKYVDKFADKTLSESQRAELKLRMQGALNLYAEFNEIQNKIEENISDSELSSQIESRETFEMDYYSVLAKAQCMTNDDRSAGSSKSSNFECASVQLPTISLPTFDGSYEHWLEFRDTFTSLVHNNSKVDNFGKLHYLKRSLIGDAKSVIDSIEISSANYSIAWELLLNRYNNSRLLVHTHVKSLFSLQSLSKESPDHIRKFIDTILKNIRSLKMLGEPVEHWDTLIVYMAVSKLDQITEREWEQYKSRLLSMCNDSSSSIKITDLINFLRDRADMLETINLNHNKPTTSFYTSREHNKKPNNNQNSPKIHCNVITGKTKNKSPHNHNSFNRNKPCPKCNGKHSLYSCESFLNCNIQDRLKFIQENKLCENCLRSGHASTECRYGPCRKCDKKHNSLTCNYKCNSENVNNQSLTLIATGDKGSSADSHDKNSSIQVHNAHLELNSARSIPVQQVLLSTAIVEIADNAGCFHKARVLLDNGSERSFITQSLCNKLKLNSIQSTQQIQGVGGLVTESTQLCDIQVKSTISTFIARIKCFVLPRITSTVPTVTIDHCNIDIPDHVHLADPTYYECESIDILLGVDIFWELLCEGRMRLSSGPFLQNTKLGWIISGPIYSEPSYRKQVQCYFTQSIDSTEAIDTQLRKFWEIEQLPIESKLGNTHMNDEERACEEHFVQTTARLSDGRFSVRIPFKHSPDTLGDSYTHAEKRFLALEKRLNRNESLKLMYREFIHEYIKLGHMTRVDSYNSPYYIMPHHGVYREHATTSRLRVVFEANTPSSSGKSLNDLQYVGPAIQGDLIGILLRFRECRYVACADIEKMYRQVSVDPKQRDLQMILWRDNPSDPIQTYHLNTVTYGEASAAFLSCRCLKQLANECNDPDVARTINNDFYVDDMCTGDDSASKLLKICHDTANVLQSGCFPLRKWIFNFDNDLSSSEMAKELSLGEDSQCKTLGLGWYNLSDELYFHTKFSGGTEDITKRKILSGASQIFDPIGLINPVITTAKTLLQSLYLLKLGWDEIVPLNIAQSWISFVNSLSSLNEIRIPRYVMGCNNTRKELHIFTDASQVAYGSCAYIRTIDNRSAVTVRLLYSKGKVASLQPVSIPRLELSGALVGARLYHKIINSLRSKFDNVVFWTDSTIVLGWLRMPCNLLKTFVQNRVAEIHELTKDSLCQWRHVSGKDNPADIVSRGQSLGMLKENSLWWNGPTYLHDPQFDVTSLKAPLVPNHTELPEIKPTAVQSHVTQQNNDESWLDFNRFSQFVRMQRAGAYALRFIYNARNKIKRIGPLSVDELNESLTTLTKLAQRESFSDLFNKNGLSVSKSNSLSKLNLFLDDKQIIRVGGRIQNSLDFSFNKKHPALLSSKHYFTLLLFRHQHKQLMHAAPQLLLYTVREAWWPVAGRSLARRVVHACVTCARLRAQTLQPIMGNLPAQRLQPGFPFERCGVDYAGPVLILNRKGRGAITVKAYICIFVCFVTRAVHLELASDLSSEAYILVLKRFISRRNKPAEIFSDNGKNFVGANNELSKFLKNCSDEIKDYATSQSIKFHTIPPYASHFGGLWERGVKSCKHHLRRVVGNAHLTFEEFTTALTQVEAILNSRPLTPLSSDPNDFLPLTPAHFLVGRPLTAPATADLRDKPMLRLTRYQRVEQIRQHFWARWSKEYVSELQQRIKWRTSSEDLKEHTMVLIKDDNLPPLKWSLGRITRVYPGRDGISRVADIRTANGTTRRAFSKICPLPVDDCSC